MRNPSATLRVAVAATLGALLLSACGGGAEQPPATPSPTSPTPATASPTATAASPTPAESGTTIVDGLGTEVTIDGPAEAIVSLSPTATETLFAIGAGDQVVAVDQFSYFPEEAPTTDLDGFNPNLEFIADLDADLVVAFSPTEELSAGLDELDIPLFVQPAPDTFDDVYDQVVQLGTLTGHEDDAADLVARMQADIEALVEATPSSARGASYFHELDSSLYTVTSETFIGRVYGLFGLHNIADAAEDASAAGYPQLSSEYVVQADPDWIFLADAGFGETPETVAARPGWDTIEAVATGQVVSLPADVPSRWGPRVVEFVQVIADSVSGAAPAGASPSATASEAG